MVKRILISLALATASPAVGQNDEGFAMATCAGYMYAITRWNSENPAFGDVSPVPLDQFDVAVTQAVEAAAARLSGGSTQALTDFIAQEGQRLYALYDGSIFLETDAAYDQQDEFNAIADDCEPRIMELPEVQPLL